MDIVVGHIVAVVVVVVVVVGQDVEQVLDAGASSERTSLLALSQACSGCTKVGEVKAGVTSGNLLKTLVVDSHHQRVHDITSASCVFEHVRGPRQTSAIRPFDQRAAGSRGFASVGLGAIARGVTYSITVQAFSLVVLEEWLTAIARCVLLPRSCHSSGDERQEAHLCAAGSAAEIELQEARRGLS